MIKEKNYIKNQKKFMIRLRKMKVYVDGASNQHIKRSGIGIVFEDEVLYEEIEYGTNNDAEYMGLIVAMERAIEKNLEYIDVYMDSKLVVEQVNGNWKINYKHLEEYNDKIKLLKLKIKIKLNHIRREFNEEADYLSKVSIDKNTPLMDKKFKHLIE